MPTIVVGSNIAPVSGRGNCRPPGAFRPLSEGCFRHQVLLRRQSLLNAGVSCLRTSATEREHRGRVFSTGAITLCGSLLHNDGDNNISRIVANVLDRFLA